MLEKIEFIWERHLVAKKSVGNAFSKSVLKAKVGSFLMIQGLQYIVIRILLFIVLVTMIAAVTCRAEVDFDKLNGSDLGMGIGARAIGMGGAFVAIADDASAAFWNPAGLTQLTSNEILISADYPAEFSSAGLVFRPPFEALEKNVFTVGLSLVNRLSFDGDSGDDTWSGYPAHLLYLAMVDPGDDFSGSIRSNTFDARLSLAFVPSKWHKLSLGMNLVYVD